MKWNVKEVAEAKGFKNARELSEHTGIPLASMYRIWKGVAEMVGLPTLERLCRVLQVQPGMLIMFIDTDNLPKAGAPPGEGEAKRESKSKRPARPQATADIR